MGREEVGGEAGEEASKEESTDYWRGRYDELEKRSLKAIAYQAEARARAWRAREEVLQENLTLQKRESEWRKCAEDLRQEVREWRRCAEDLRQEVGTRKQEGGFEEAQEEGRRQGKKLFFRLKERLRQEAEKRRVTSAYYDGPGWYRFVEGLIEEAGRWEELLEEAGRREETGDEAEAGVRVQEALQDQADHVRFEEPRQGRRRKVREDFLFAEDWFKAQKRLEAQVDQGGPTDQGDSKEGSSQSGQEGGGGAEEAPSPPKASGGSS